MHNPRGKIRPPAIPIEDCGDEVAQPLDQRAASRRAGKIVKRVLTIPDMFNHSAADGQCELSGIPRILRDLFVTES